MEVRNDLPRSLGVEQLVYLGDEALPVPATPVPSKLELAGGVLALAVALGIVRTGRTTRLLGAVGAAVVGHRWYAARR